MVDDMTTLHVVATLPIDPAHAAEAAPVLAELAEASRGDAGCLVYEVYESASTPGVFVTIEEWESQADLDAHGKQPHIGAAFKVIGPWLVGDVAVHPLRTL